MQNVLETLEGVWDTDKHTRTKVEQLNEDPGFQSMTRHIAATLPPYWCHTALHEVMDQHRGQLYWLELILAN